MVKLEVKLQRLDTESSLNEGKFIIANEKTHLGVYGVNFIEENHGMPMTHEQIAEKYNIPKEKVLGGANYSLFDKFEIKEGSCEYGEIPESLAREIGEKSGKEYVIGLLWGVEEKDIQKWKELGYE